MDSFGFEVDERSRTIQNAQEIVEKIVGIYESEVATGHVGATATGIPNNFSKIDPGPVGLVYGRIQSGKTRAMVASTAMAFDNGFRISIVMTSNMNDLVTQTHLDFTKDLKGVSVFTKDDELDKHIEDAKLDLEQPGGRILIVTSKGKKSLENITNFLNNIGAKLFPMVIFDDEGDQASLDANTYKRSSTGNLTLQPTEINRLISKLRNKFSASVYVSVTGTPQAVLLQSGSSNNRPSFVVMLPHGNGYVGGDFFFDTEEPENNSYHIISNVPDEDKDCIIDLTLPIPDGLKNSILFFLLAASAAVRNLGFPSKGKEKDKGYQFLCHPSLKNSEQGKAEDRISNFLTEVKAVLLGRADTMGIEDAIKKQYGELKIQLGAPATPTLADLKETIKQELLRKKILVINKENTKRRGIEYGPGFNFLIGGNSLGRGIAVPNLLVTYYVRHAKKSQIDTMHQHARMFGYRMTTLPYTRLFITKKLYYRFRDIHYSDKGLRSFIETHKDTLPDSFPVEFSSGLGATRPGVLNADTTETVWPGAQIYPNYIKLPQAPRSYAKVIDIVGSEIDADSSNMIEMENKGTTGAVINADKAIKIVSLIKTKSQNTWHDKTIAVIIKKLSQRLGNQFRLKFRTAERKIGKDGFLSTGTLSGTEATNARGDTMPTLSIISVTGKADSIDGAGEIFVFPTIVVPDALPQVFVFSKE